MNQCNGDRRPEYKGGLVIIPAAVMQLKIPVQAKLIFGAIWAIVGMEAHKCWISNRRLAEIIGTRPNSRFRLNLKVLADHRLIERIIDPRKHREQIRVTWTPDTVIERPGPRKRSRGDATPSGRGDATPSGTENLSEKRTEKTNPLHSGLPGASKVEVPLPPGPQNGRLPKTEAEMILEADAKKRAFYAAAAARAGKTKA